MLAPQVTKAYDRRLLGAALTGAALITLLAAVGLHFARGTDVDDSWIHLRVALNWANALGPVYNAGERVEASTSPAWLALLTLGIRLGADGPAWALFLSFACAAAVGAGSALLAFRLTNEHRLAVGLLAALLTAGNITFTYWASTRMEVAFACALFVWSINLALSTRGMGSAMATAALAALTGLARPELLSMVPVVIALSLSQVSRDHRLKLGLAAGAVALLMIAGHLAARYSYYGHFVPNTYVAKVAGKSLAMRLDSSLGVVVDFALYQPLLLLTIAWTAARFNGLPRLLAGLCALLLAAVAWTGGDHFQYSRLAVPIVPVASVLAAVLIAALARPLQVALTALLLVQAPVGWKRDGWRAVSSGMYVSQTEAVARAMHRLPDGAIATLGIGVLGYRCPERRVVDLVGLADAHIARTPHIPSAASGHDHSDANYVVSQAPAVVFLHILTTDRALSAAEELQNLIKDRYWYQSGLDLFRNSQFQRDYRPINLALDNGRFVRIWTRREHSLAAVADMIVP